MLLIESLSRAESRRLNNTPWGKVEDVRLIGEDASTMVYAVSTPGHGGIYVPDHLLDKIDKDLRCWARSWSGSENWYEEDCCYAAVIVSFPELFSKSEIKAAKETLKNERANFGQL